MKGNNIDDRYTVENEVRNHHTEDMIAHWYSLMQSARQELHSTVWQHAVRYYQEAHLHAKLLLEISNCKNCAILCYVRTLMEYGYSLRKTGQRALLSELLVQGWHSLNAYVSESLAAQLLAPLYKIETATNNECEIYINQLFADDAISKQQLH